MKQKAVVLTDAATEFSSLMIRFYNESVPAGTKAYSVIESFLKSNNSDADVIKAYGILNKRAGDLVSFVDKWNDDFSEDDVKKSVIDALNRLQKTFSISRTLADWSQVKKECIAWQDVQTVKMLSRTSRAYRPLIKITSSHIEEVTEAIETSHAEILEAHDLPDWAKETIAETIDDLKFVLVNIDLFGHDETINSILKLHSTLTHVEKEIEKTGVILNRLEKTAICFVLLVDLFTAMPNTVQAIPIWKGWLSNISKSEIRLLAPPPKRLESPKPKRDNETNV